MQLINKFFIASRIIKSGKSIDLEPYHRIKLREEYLDLVYLIGLGLSHINKACALCSHPEFTNHDHFILYIIAAEIA